MTRVRKDVGGLGAGWNDTLLWYANAVRTLQSRPVTIGAELRVWLRRHVPEPVARYGALTLLVLFGCFSVAEALLVGR